MKIPGITYNINHKNIKQLNLTFTIVNDEDRAMSAEGNYILGMFKIEKEDFESWSNRLAVAGKLLLFLLLVNINYKHIFNEIISRPSKW